MKILSSAIQFTMQHQKVARQDLHESLRVWRTTAAPAPTSSPAPHEAQNGSVSAGPGDLRMLLLQLLIEHLTGRKMKLADVAQLLGEPAPPPELPDPDHATAVGTAPDWGAVYERHESRMESEQTQFAATALIRTADGKEIQMAVALNMSRQFMSQNDLQIRAGAAARMKDPLVINFNGTAAQLTDTKFSFDLNADGRKEEIATLGGQSAFLALDRNGDGVINDGSELFGPHSGNGFADLAAFDSDHNGWIDEADPVFAQLKLWLPGAIQSGAISSLRDKGIGALYVGAVETPFELKQGEELNGAVRSTGLYLNEDGSAGTVQQVDFKV